jgi:molybdenum cofactor cytidylyltransferase
VRRGVDLRGVEVVVNVAYGSGCSSSIAAALTAVDPRIDVLVLLLGDQPGVRPETVRALLAGRGDAPLAACRYEDGRGHPLAFARSAFGDLAALHGDKGVWRLMDRGPVAEVAVPGTIPRDVDTLEDYEAVLAERS